MLYNLALDRILELAPAKDEPYYRNSNFDPSTFFDDIVGVTKGINEHPEEVRFLGKSGTCPLCPDQTYS